MLAYFSPMTRTLSFSQADDVLQRVPSALPSMNLQDALDTVMRDSLRPLATGLSVLYAVFAVSHRWTLPPTVAGIMTLVATATAIMLLGLSLLLLRWSVPTRWAHPIGVGVAGLVLINSLLHLFLVSEPQQTTNLMLLAVGAGCLFLSSPWLVLTLIVMAASWGGVVWRLPPSPSWVHFGFGLLSASVLSLIVHMARVRAFQRLEILRAEREKAEETRLRGELAEAAKKELEREVTERQRAEEQLRYRLTIEEALSHASSLFVASTPPDLTRVLQVLGEAVSANRAYIFLAREDGTVVDNTHEWCDGQTEPQIQNLQGLDPSFFPWWRAKLERGENVVITEVATLPEEAGAEKSILQSQDICSLIAVPINSQEGTLVGFLGFDDTQMCRVWSDADSRILRVVSEMISIDLARTRTEQTLRDRETRLDTIFRTAGDAILTLDLQGYVTGVNPAAEFILGYDQEEMVGNPMERFLTEGSAQLVRERTEKALRGEPLSSIFELEACRKDGTKIPVEGKTRFLRQDGKPVGVVSIFRDVTEKKVIEQQRADFLAMLTHDIRNPLGVILGYADLLIEMAQQRGATEEEEILSKLQTNALTVHSLVTNYLDLSRIEAGHLDLAKKPMALNDVLRQVKRQYEAEARRRHLNLEMSLQEELPSIEGNPLALERVFTNLLQNALKFTPALGRVTLSSAQRHEEVVAAVTDTGPGIASEEIPSLFEKYKRTQSSQYQEGTGLGLFIAKALVEAHGGRIEVASTPGQGARFAVILPIVSLCAQAAL